MAVQPAQMQTDADRDAAAVAVLQAWLAEPGTDTTRAAAVASFLGAFADEIAEEAEVVAQAAPLPGPDTLRGAYLAAALASAEYESLEDGTIFARVPPLPGIWANAPTHSACETDLAATVHDWISAQLGAGVLVPVLAGIDLNPRRA